MTHETMTEHALLEARGWTSPAVACDSKITALESLVNLAAVEAVPSVSYRSQGNLLIVAADEPARARAAALALCGDLHVTLLGAGPAPDSRITGWEGRVESLTGYLGEFTATLSGLRTDGAAPAGKPVPARFDLVLDFSRAPLFAMRLPPQGYFPATADEAALATAIEDLRESVGEFEKPRYFAYRENLCAHSRSQVTGCTACIDVCSTQAIASDGDHVKVDPHLCMGCGACATVCPSGAMSYQFPRAADRGAQFKQLLTAYRHAGGRDACLVVHDEAAQSLFAQAASTGQGLPARALPVRSWHVAATGIDLLLPAIAYGASQVVVVAMAYEDREYLAALRSQMQVAQAIVSGLGYPGRHFDLIVAADAEALARGFAALEPATTVATPASFMLSNDKRTAIEFAVEHLVREAPAPVDEVALPAGALFGEVRVDKAKCTLCLSCVGACPESALMDGVDLPMLKFLERNCVQCGLCANTCPEDAITLSPRLLLTPAVREPRVLNETQPFPCVSCGKAFGTKLMVEAMVGRLAGHSMFTGGMAIRRLQMCADCRVVDMMKNKDEASILRGGGDA